MALLVSLIVLLILAGVSLSMVLSKDGLFKRAENTTLTTIQNNGNKVAKDSNGNLITVPEGFKVLTSEGTNGDEKCNIYDIASNTLEWETEAYSNEHVLCYVRGGAWYRKDKCPAFRGTFSQTIGANNHVAFRPLLYLTN